MVGEKGQQGRHMAMVWVETTTLLEMEEESSEGVWLELKKLKLIEEEEGKHDAGEVAKYAKPTENKRPPDMVHLSNAWERIMAKLRRVFALSTFGL